MYCRFISKEILTIREAVWLTDNTYKYEDLVRMMGEVVSTLEGKIRVSALLPFPCLALRLWVGQEELGPSSPQLGIDPQGFPQEAFDSSSHGHIQSHGARGHGVLRRHCGIDITQADPDPTSIAWGALWFLNSMPAASPQIPTVVDYKEVLLTLVPVAPRTQHLCSFLCELSLLHTSLSTYAPAHLAAAALLLARLTHGQSKEQPPVGKAGGMEGKATPEGAGEVSSGFGW